MGPLDLYKGPPELFGGPPVDLKEGPPEAPGSASLDHVMGLLVARKAHRATSWA